MMKSSYLASVLLIVCLSVLMMDMALCFFQQPFNNNLFNNQFQGAGFGGNNLWGMNNYGWNPAASFGAATGWNNNNYYNPAASFGTQGFGFNNFNNGFNGGGAGFPFGNNNYVKSAGYPSAYGGRQVITTPTREGYDVEYQIPGGRAKKYYSSQSFVQQVL